MFFFFRSCVYCYTSYDHKWRFIPLLHACVKILPCCSLRVTCIKVYQSKHSWVGEMGRKKGEKRERKNFVGIPDYYVIFWCLVYSSTYLHLRNIKKNKNYEINSERFNKRFNSCWRCKDCGGYWILCFLQDLPKALHRCPETLFTPSLHK